MAQATVQLPLIPTGWYMSWDMYTQAAFKICVTLQDSKTTYVNNQCRQQQAFGVLAQGFQPVQGNNLNLIINIPQSSAISTIVTVNAVQVPSGLIVAWLYTILIEDGIDTDYNDLYVTIAAWAKNG
jgi:hypothetical protein